MRHHRGSQERRENVADRPTGLHESGGLAAMLRRPGFRHQHRTRRPDAAHPDAHQGAPHEQRRDAGGGRGQAGEARVDKDGIDQRARPADAVGQHAEHHAAECGRQ